MVDEDEGPRGRIVFEGLSVSRVPPLKSATCTSNLGALALRTVLYRDSLLFCIAQCPQLFPPAPVALGRMGRTITSLTDPIKVHI